MILKGVNSLFYYRTKRIDTPLGVLYPLLYISCVISYNKTQAQVTVGPLYRYHLFHKKTLFGFFFTYKLLLRLCNTIYITLILAGNLDLQFKILNALF